MSSMPAGRLTTRLLVPLAAALLLVTGCSGTGGKSAGAGNDSQVTVTSRSGQLGDYLTDGKGRALYLFMADSGGSSACADDCAKFWPPLTAAGAATSTGAASSEKLNQITRAGGEKQITYNGHPLYYYSGDKGANDLNGQGLNDFGGQWWLVSPQGEAITKAGTGSPSDGGYGYGK
jgi:predicted lipoprotein with Yx(FWY)xxD motif